MHRIPTAILTAAMALLTGCSSIDRNQSPAPVQELGANLGRPIDTDLLARYLTGSFSSASQAEADPDHFFDIRLHAAPIWPDRNDGPWLYVEQAAASSLDRPYRQRVYRLSEPSPGVFSSDVYTMPEPRAHAGWWRTPTLFAGALSPDDLELREGCTIEMRWEDGTFVGGTAGTGCGSSLRGAAYATSEVVLHDNRLVTWDRGFDSDGEQVWGATAGGYVFQRTGD